LILIQEVSEAVVRVVVDWFASAHTLRNTPTHTHTH
jgi:hypothetical protein